MAELGYLIYLNFACAAINVLLIVEIIYQIVEIYHHPHTKAPFGHPYQPVQHRTGITRNTRTLIDNFPYIAALVVRDIDEEYDLLCATVIVSLYYSMSDVRCKIVLEQYTELHRKVRSESPFWQYGGTLHDIIGIITHENPHNHMENDVTFIKVNPGFSQEQIIPVAGANFNMKAGDLVHLAGWGETAKKASHTNSHSLKQFYFVTAYLTDKDQCKNMLKKFYKTDKKEFCVEVPEHTRDHCIYNLGGFAVYNNILVGLITCGAPICGGNTNHGFHTNLASLNGWIRKLSDTYRMEIDFKDNI